jgi:hypothetical protein
VQKRKVATKKKETARNLGAETLQDAKQLHLPCQNQKLDARVLKAETTIMLTQRGRKPLRRERSNLRKKNLQSVRKHCNAESETHRKASAMKRK